MENKCTGYWETCACDDCQKVSELYEELDWLITYEPDSKHDIKLIVDTI